MRSLLPKAAQATMPFGRYKGRQLADIPEPYLAWMAQKGFPEGELGQLMALVYDLKVNGLEYLLRPLRKR